MGRIITIIFILFSLAGFSQTFTMKDSRAGDTVQRIIQSTEVSGIAKYILISNADTAEIRWNGTSLLFNGYNVADSTDLTTDSIQQLRTDVNNRALLEDSSLWSRVVTPEPYLQPKITADVMRIGGKLSLNPYYNTYSSTDQTITANSLYSSGVSHYMFLDANNTVSGTSLSIFNNQAVTTLTNPIFKFLETGAIQAGNTIGGQGQLELFTSGGYGYIRVDSDDGLTIGDFTDVSITGANFGLKNYSTVYADSILTAVVNSDSALVTSGAVVDYVAPLYDSISVHLDTLQAHRTDINANRGGKVNADNISQVEFIFGVDTIKESFGHEHTEYALETNTVSYMLGSDFKIIVFNDTMCGVKISTADTVRIVPTR